MTEMEKCDTVKKQKRIRADKLIELANTKGVKAVPISLEVWGDYACFTRPEMKTERVS